MVSNVENFNIVVAAVVVAMAVVVAVTITATIISTVKKDLNKKRVCLIYWPEKSGLFNLFV
jgi:hypothetical protein